MIELDKQQAAAVKTTAKRALVLAGAGSGKTRVLVERIANLIENEKVSPHEIMAFTFTRKAAEEMRTRLAERIGYTARDVTMGTMHALALQMVHRFGDHVGYKPQLTTVYCPWEENFLLREIAGRVGFYTKKKWAPVKKKDVDQMFFDYYQRGITPSETEHAAEKLFDALIFEMRQNNALTYGALLVGLHLLIGVMSKHMHFKHILVDESQDIDEFQWKIIEQMVDRFKADLFCVGDIDQSIYEFRGAVPGYLVEHSNEFTVMRLETNYRSDSFIVEAANTLIQHNTQRLEKTMKAFEDPQNPVEVHAGLDSSGIVKLIQFLSKEAPGAVRAVLCRVHGPLAKLSQLLTDAGIENNYVGKKSALTNSEGFRRFNAFLKLIVNPYDNFSFLLVRDILGIKPDEYSSIQKLASDRGWSHFQTYQAIKEGRDFKTLCDNASLKHTVLNIQSIVDEFTFLNENEEIKPIETNPIVDFILDSEKDEVHQYLTWLATYDLQDEIAEASEGALQLMTIHAAKGLEWPTVIVAGCNEGMLPHKRSIKEQKVEEERRLAYVAWTRAEDTLILTVRPEVKVHENGRETFEPISRFIEESSSVEKN